VFGTRPEAIKMAPVVQELGRAPDIEPLVAVTAQHRQLLDQVLAWFGIHPDADLDVMVDGQTLTHITTRVLEGCARVFSDLRPDFVLVHGDTTTTLAAALAAYYARLPLGHVEAGLRTGDKYAPYPEEANRRLTDALADLHLAPTDWARDNLLREGTSPETVVVTGNTAIDALLRTARGAAAARGPRRAGQPRVLLVEVHRRENFGRPMEEIVLAVRDVVRRFPDLRAVFSVHPNPNVEAVVRRHLEGEPRVELHPPFDYPEWARRMASAHLIATDSGGLQEEAPALGTPVVVLREKTERPEAVAAGTAVVAGTGREAVAATLARVLGDPAEHARMASARNPYGDGRAAERTVEAVRHRLGLRPDRPEEWAYAAGRCASSKR
jgi:UDP-N-acetylglucosamine 2-epimerase (non-hydrolysing)